MHAWGSFKPLTRDTQYSIVGPVLWTLVAVDGMQESFNLGFLGAIITTILASIAWQLVAGAFPIAFLSNPLVLVFLRIALAIEATGICAGAWFLAKIHKNISGFQFDEVYVGTPEEQRAASEHMKKDSDEKATEMSEVRVMTESN